MIRRNTPPIIESVRKTPAISEENPKNEENFSRVLNRFNRLSQTDSQSSLFAILGDKPVCFIPDDFIDESLGEWRFSLIGRLNLVKLKFESATTILRKQWNIKGTIEFIPLGKGFFIIKLDNPEDKHHIWDRLWPVESQYLKLRAWEPNFIPEKSKNNFSLCLGSSSWYEY